MPLIASIRSPILSVPSRSAGPPDRILVTMSGRDLILSSLPPPRTVKPYELFSFSSWIWTVCDLTAWCGWMAVSVRVKNKMADERQNRNNQRVVVVGCLRQGGRLYSNSRQSESPAFLIKSIISSCLSPCVLMPLMEMIMSPIWSSSDLEMNQRWKHKLNGAK